MEREKMRDGSHIFGRELLFRRRLLHTKLLGICRRLKLIEIKKMYKDGQRERLPVGYVEGTRSRLK